MNRTAFELLLLEDGTCEKSECLRIEESDDPLKNIVSREEFEQLKGEHSEEVEGVTYEEYCETERECWNEMLKRPAETFVERKYSRLFNSAIQALQFFGIEVSTMKQLFTLKETSSDVKNPSDIFRNIKKINIDLSQENFLVFCPQ